jgi:hypothetical protein
MQEPQFGVPTHPSPIIPPDVPVPLPPYDPPDRGTYRPTRRFVILTVAVAAALSLMMIVPGLLLPPRSAAGELLERVRAELVPADGTATEYGVLFSSEGYQALLSWHSQYQVSAEAAGSFEALDVSLPCCGFEHPLADESKNCGCGHHQALYGLAKRLLSTGYGGDQVQAEVTRWAAYFFPKETVETTLAERAGSDPAFQEALEELQQKGGC